MFDPFVHVVALWVFFAAGWWGGRMRSTDAAYLRGKADMLKRVQDTGGMGPRDKPEDDSGGGANAVH